MTITRFASITYVFWRCGGNRSLFRLALYRARAEELRRIKTGSRTKAEYLADLEARRPQTLAKQRAYRAQWIKQYRAQKRPYRDPPIPSSAARVINQRRQLYLNWWKRTLYRQENPLPPPAPRKKKTLTQKVRKRLKRLYDAKLGVRTSSLIGCSTQFLKSYLAAKFTHTMSWDNHGTVWHIDHIIPLSRFNLKDPLQLAQACHYSNLQPLLIKHNLEKSDHIPHPLQTFLPIQLPASIVHYPAQMKKRQKKLNDVSG
jgi:hypothetical protein